MKRRLSALTGLALAGLFLSYAVGKETYDVISLALVICLALGLGLISFGAASLAAIGRGGRTLFARPRPADLLPAHRTILHGMIRNTYAAGGIGLLTGLTIMLRNLGDPAVIGPGVASAMMCLLYAVILSECLLRPMLNTLRVEAERAAEPATPTCAFEVLAPTMDRPTEAPTRRDRSAHPGQQGLAEGVRR